MNPVVTSVNNYHRNLRKIIKYLAYLIFIQQIFLTTFIVCQPNNQIDLQENLNLNNNNKIVGFDVSKPTKSRKYISSIEQNNQKKSSKKGKHYKKHRKHVLRFSTINSEENPSYPIKNNLKSHQQKNHLDPNKVYFDYYPVEKVNVSYDPADDEKINVILLSKIKTNEYDKIDDNAFNHVIQESTKKPDIQKTDRRRIKRDTTAQTDDGENVELDNNHKSKRNANYLRRFINYEQGAGYHYNPPPVPVPSYSTGTSFGDYNTFGTPNYPWNDEYNRFYSSLPNRPPTSYGIYLKYPIRGVYYNPISPSGNNFVPAYPNEEGEIPMEPDLETRFDDDPDRPVWNKRPRPNTGRPLNEPPRQSPPQQSPPQQSPPRQPSNRPNESTSPPLIHRPIRPGSNSGQERPQQQFPATQPPIQQNPNNRPENLPPNAFAGVNQGGGLSNGGFTGSTNTIADAQQPQQPSRCVWAIVTCCTRNNMEIRYSCFEQLGCHGAFWDLNPCADQYRRVAVLETSKFLD